MKEEEKELQKSRQIIDYPTKEELDRTVADTIAKVYPKQKNMISYIGALYRQIGLSNVLHGMKSVGAVIAVVYVVVLGCGCGTQWQSGFQRYTSVILFSPAIFQLLLGLSILAEKEQQVYELARTSKYTIYHMLVLRMLLTVLICMVMNGGFCLLVFWKRGIQEVLQMLLLSVTALLGYSLCYLCLLTKSCQLKHQIRLYGVWVFGNLGINLLFQETYQYVALEIPLVCHMVVWGILIVLFLQKLSQFLYCNCQYNL